MRECLSRVVAVGPPSPNQRRERCNPEVVRPEPGHQSHRERQHRDGPAAGHPPGPRHLSPPATGTLQPNGSSGSCTPQCGPAAADQSVRERDTGGTLQALAELASEGYPGCAGGRLLCGGFCGDRPGVPPTPHLAEAPFIPVPPARQRQTRPVSLGRGPGHPRWMALLRGSDLFSRQAIPTYSLSLSLVKGGRRLCPLVIRCFAMGALKSSQ